MLDIPLNTSKTEIVAVEGHRSKSSLHWLLALHVLRRLIVTQGDEFRVAQMVHVGPVRILYLRDKLRLQPAAFPLWVR